MYLVSIQTPSDTREFVSKCMNLILREFDETESPKVLVVKSVDVLPDETE